MKQKLIELQGEIESPHDFNNTFSIINSTSRQKISNKIVENQ